VLAPALLVQFALFAGASDAVRLTPWAPVSYFATTEGQTAVQEVMRTTGATGLSLALVDGDRFVWTEHFGFMDWDVSGDRPILPFSETLYNLGETSKVIAAIAVMKLVEQERIRLDDPVTLHLPAFTMLSPEYAQITIRHLLSHAAGLPGTDWRNRYSSAPIRDYARQVLATLARQHLKHLPGYLHVYCNDGFTLIEALVDAVSGRSYVQFVQEEIFNPVDMSHTRFSSDQLFGLPYARAFAGKVELPAEYANGYAAGGCYSTPEDMAKLIQMLVNGGTHREVRILSEESIREMGRNQTGHSFDPVPSALAAFGLGWDTVTQPALQAVNIPAWAKSGDTPHYGTSMIVVPAERMGIIVTGVSGLGSLGSEAAASIAERILLRALVEKGRLPEMPKLAAPVVAAEATAAPDILPALFGVYASSDAAYRAGPGRFYNTLRLERYQLQSATWDPVAENLRLREDGWFHTDDDPGVGYLFETTEKRTYLAKSWPSRFSTVRLVLAEKVEPASGLGPTWGTLNGKSWLLANDLPGSDLVVRAPRLDLLSLPGLDNLLFVKWIGFYPVDCQEAGVPADPAKMMLRIPGFHGRDMDELELLPRNGESWLRSGSQVFRPLTTVPVLRHGDNPVTIGAEGYAEWRLVTSSAATQTLLMEGFEHWKLFDGNFKRVSSSGRSGRVSIPAMAGQHYLLLCGGPGVGRSVQLQTEL
jgi:CubicO group peptidase (beta-lactamase class C family)